MFRPKCFLSLDIHMSSILAELLNQPLPVSHSLSLSSSIVSCSNIICSWWQFFVFRIFIRKIWIFALVESEIEKANSGNNDVGNPINPNTNSFLPKDCKP